MRSPLDRVNESKAVAPRATMTGLESSATCRLNKPAKMRGTPWACVISVLERRKH